jgi:antitoxin (DNA-binding transcriptional repressor) of toxin-antitoxin stability system
MKYVKLADARANFAALFDEVERGETLIITRGGATAQTVRRIDEIRRADEETKQQRLRAMRDLRDLKKGAGPATIEELMEWRDVVRG